MASHPPDIPIPTDLPYIPPDLHPTILSFLPSKSLVKFLVVSKSWYSIITDPFFKAIHLTTHKSLSHNHTSHRSFLLRTNTDTFYLIDDSVSRRIQSPPAGFNSIAATCDNLICLSNKNFISFPPNKDKKDVHLLLWNPMINKFVKRIKNVLHYKYCTYILGLGYTPAEHLNCYKIVIIFYNNIYSLEEVHPPYAQVFAINNAIEGWKTVSLPEFDSHLRSFSQSCFVNEFIHWIVFRSNDEALESVSILRFNLNNDVFDELQIPATLKAKIDPCLDLAVIQNSIGVIDYVNGGGAVVWKMENYGEKDEYWKKLYMINWSCNVNLEKEVWKKEQGKLFISTASGQLIVFNVESLNNCGWYEGHLGYKFEGTHININVNDVMHELHLVGVDGGKAFGLIQSLALFQMHDDEFDETKKKGKEKLHHN